MGLATWIFLLASAPQQPATVTSTDVAAIEQRAQPTVDRFYSAVRQCGAHPPFKPTIRVARSDGIIHYDPPTGTVVLYPWSTMDQDAQQNVAKWAGATGAREAYEEIFNDTLVAHELGHWLQSFQPEPRTADGQYDRWFVEQDANRIAVAFWREHPAPGEMGESRIQSWLGVDPEGRPNPVPPPEGVSIETFFTANTMTIVRGDAYGWYQGVMTSRAVSEDPAPRFCNLVARWLPTSS